MKKLKGRASFQKKQHEENQEKCVYSRGKLKIRSETSQDEIIKNLICLEMGVWSLFFKPVCPNTQSAYQ